MRIASIALALSLLAQAQPAPHQAEVDRIFSAFNTHTPGCAVGVAHNGEVVFKSSYGMADLERNVPITPDTVFESGSVAKQFTAAALLLLAQQGKISMDDPMRKYLPELSDYGAPLTIRQVISHISGIREWRPIATFSGKPEGTFVLTNQDLLDMAAKQRALNFDPGTQYSYTNTGFNVSTILIERVLNNGKTFQAFTHDNIFGPLGMTHTRWRDNFRSIVPNRALAYGRTGSGDWVSQTPIENIIGAGGLLTTVGDLLLWNENFTHAKVGGPDFVKAQQTPAILKNGRQITYAAGLVVQRFDGINEVAHSGATGGYRTWLGRYPDQKLSVAVLCNAASAVPTNLGRETARLWTRSFANISWMPKVPPDPTQIPSFAGHYRSLRNNTVSELRMRDGKLTLLPALALRPIAAGKFDAAGDREFTFEEGTPTRLRITSPDTEQVFERVQLVQPTASDLAPLVGKYHGAETSSTLEIAMRGSELTLRISSSAPLILKPTFRDAFTTPSGDVIFFVRDPTGKVIALSVGDDRVWDLRFSRL